MHFLFAMILCKGAIIIDTSVGLLAIPSRAAKVVYLWESRKKLVINSITTRANTCVLSLRDYRQYINEHSRCVGNGRSRLDQIITSTVVISPCSGPLWKDGHTSRTTPTSMSDIRHRRLLLWFFMCSRHVNIRSLRTGRTILFPNTDKDEHRRI